MTRTIQPRSLAYIQETIRQNTSAVIFDKAEAVKTKAYLLSIFDSLIILSSKMNKLNSETNKLARAINKYQETVVKKHSVFW